MSQNLLETDVFDVQYHKFHGLYTPNTKHNVQLANSNNLDMFVSPMSTLEVYDKLREKYHTSLNALKNKNSVTALKKKHFQRRESRANISAMLHDVNTIAATPLKFSSESHENLLSMRKVNTVKAVKKFSQYTQRNQNNKKSIEDIFGDYFGEGRFDGSKLMDNTPPFKVQSRKVELVANGDDIDVKQQLTSSELLSAWCNISNENSVSPPKTSNYSPAPRSTYHSHSSSSPQRTDILVIHHSDDSQEEGTALEESTYISYDTNLEFCADQEVSVMLPQQPAVCSSPQQRRHALGTSAESIATPSRQRASTLPRESPLYHSLDSHSLQQQSQGQGVSSGSVVHDCVEFSARKVAALVRSMKKHDRSVRKSISSVLKTSSKYTAEQNGEDHHKEQEEYMEYDRLHQLDSNRSVAEISSPIADKRPVVASTPAPTLLFSQTTPILPSHTSSSRVATSTPAAGLGVAGLSSAVKRTASRKSIAASLSSIAEMGVLSSDVTFAPTPAKTSRVEQQGVLTESTVKFALDPSVGADRRKSLVRSSSVPTQQSLTTPARPRWGHAFSSLDSAMKFDFEVPSPYIKPGQRSERSENDSLSDMNASTGGFSRDATQQSAIKTPWTKRNNKMRELMRTCDNVMSQITDLF